MADLKISQLDSVTAAASDSVIPIVQGGVTKKILVSNLTNEYIRKAEHSVIFCRTIFCKCSCSRLCYRVCLSRNRRYMV